MNIVRLTQYKKADTANKIIKYLNQKLNNNGDTLTYALDTLKQKLSQYSDTKDPTKNNINKNLSKTTKRYFINV